MVFIRGNGVVLQLLAHEREHRDFLFSSFDLRYARFGALGREGAHL